MLLENPRTRQTTLEIVIVNISDFQKAADSTDQSSKAPWVGLTQNIHGLSEKVGALSGCLKRRLRDKGSYSVESFREDFQRYIGESLWYLSAVCTHFNLELQDVAEQNLESNKKRWVAHRNDQGELFHDDYQFPESERLPKNIVAHFQSTTGPNSISWLSVTSVQLNGVRFGDPIDDNTSTEDGYRYHDALHFAFAAFLNWSPVVRAILGRKRKSNLEIDKFEDGARACDTEEAVSNFIHHEARRNNFFAGAKRLDTDFLIKIQGMVVDLEVRDRTLSEWEECILQSYNVIRELQTNNGGIVEVRLDQPRIAFRKF